MTSNGQQPAQRRICWSGGHGIGYGDTPCEGGPQDDGVNVYEPSVERFMGALHPLSKQLHRQNSFVWWPILNKQIQSCLAQRITSSDAATKGLKMRHGMILGQAAPGMTEEPHALCAF